MKFNNNNEKHFTLFFDIDSLTFLSPEIDAFNLQLFVFFPIYLHENTVPVPVELQSRTICITDIVFIEFGCFGEGNVFRTCICFPHIPAKEKSQELFEFFSTNILFPALELAEIDLQRIPRTVNSFTEKYRTTYGHVQQKSFWIQAEEVVKVTKIMRDLVGNVSSCNWNFSEFFFHTRAIGIKALTCSLTVDEAEAKARELIERSFLKPPRTVFYDISFEVRPFHPKITLAFSSSFINHLKKQASGGSVIKVDSFCQSITMGGIRIHFGKRKVKSNGLLFVQAYSVEKEVLASKRDFIAKRLKLGGTKAIEVEKITKKISQLMEDSKMQSFGCRLEFRVDKFGLARLKRSSKHIENVLCGQGSIETLSTQEIVLYRTVKARIYGILIQKALLNPQICFNSEVQGFCLLIQLLYRSLFSKLPSSSFTRIIFSEGQNETKGDFCFEECIRNSNCFLLDKRFIDFEESRLITCRQNDRLSSMFKNCKAKVQKYSDKKLNTVENKRIIMKQLPLVKSCENPKELALQVFIEMQTELIGLLPKWWFKSIPICLQMNELVKKSLVQYDFVMAESWEIVYRRIFNPTNLNVRWTKCRFYNRFKKSEKDLSKPENQEFISFFRELFWSLEILPFVDDKRGNLYIRSKKPRYKDNDRYCFFQQRKAETCSIVPNTFDTVAKLPMEEQSRKVESVKEATTSIDTVANSPLEKQIVTKHENSTKVPSQTIQVIVETREQRIASEIFDQFLDFLKTSVTRREISLRNEPLSRIEQKKYLTAYEKYFPTLAEVIEGLQVISFFEKMPRYYCDALAEYSNLSKELKIKLYYKLLKRFYTLKKIPKISRSSTVLS